MTGIAHHINDMKRKHEHKVRVQEVQSLLDAWPVRIFCCCCRIRAGRCRRRVNDVVVVLRRART